MKKPYQIDAQRAVKQLAEMAADGNPSVQMILPMAEIMGWLRKGVGELVRQAGLQLMDLTMEAEVEERVGKRSQPQEIRAFPSHGFNLTLADSLCGSNMAWQFRRGMRRLCHPRLDAARQEMGRGKQMPA